MMRYPPSSPLFPYTTLFRSDRSRERDQGGARAAHHGRHGRGPPEFLPWKHGRPREAPRHAPGRRRKMPKAGRSEEHTSELQSQFHLVCRLLLEKKKTKTSTK